MCIHINSTSVSVTVRILNCGKKPREIIATRLVQAELHSLRNKPAIMYGYICRVTCTVCLCFQPSMSVSQIRVRTTHPALICTMISSAIVRRDSRENAATKVRLVCHVMTPRCDVMTSCLITTVDWSPD